MHCFNRNQPTNRSTIFDGPIMKDNNERFPIHSEERPLRFGGGALMPLAIAQQELTALAKEHTAQLDRLLIELAQSWFQIRRVQMEMAEHGGAGPAHWREALALIAGNLNEALRAHQISVRDLTDEPWSEALRAVADVRGSEPAGGIAAPRVSYVEIPVIQRGERLLLRGAVLLDVPVVTDRG